MKHLLFIATLMLWVPAWGAQPPQRVQIDLEVHVRGMHAGQGHDVLEHDGKQWRDYMRLRDLLRRSSTARDQYEQAKQQLAKDVGDDRVAYTNGKSHIINLLLHKA